VHLLDGLLSGRLFLVLNERESSVTLSAIAYEEVVAFSKFLELFLEIVIGEGRWQPADEDRGLQHWQFFLGVCHADYEDGLETEVVIVEFL